MEIRRGRLTAWGPKLGVGRMVYEMAGSEESWRSGWALMRRWGPDLKSFGWKVALGGGNL